MSLYIMIRICPTIKKRFIFTYILYSIPVFQIPARLRLTVNMLVSRNVHGKVKFGLKINDIQKKLICTNLAVVASNGLDATTIIKLVPKYPPPTNLSILSSPKINPEPKIAEGGYSSEER
nr:unnamed protein product [Callosobruchus analis]